MNDPVVRLTLTAPPPVLLTAAVYDSPSPAGSVNNTDPDTRPLSASAAPADHPPATGGATTAAGAGESTAAAGAGADTAAAIGPAPARSGAVATATGYPTVIPRLVPNSPASISRNTPHASTPSAFNGPDGAPGTFRFTPSTDSTLASNLAGRIAGATAAAGLGGAMNTAGTATDDTAPTRCTAAPADTGAHPRPAEEAAPTGTDTGLTSEGAVAGAPPKAEEMLGAGCVVEVAAGGATATGRGSPRSVEALSVAAARGGITTGSAESATEMAPSALAPVVGAGARRPGRDAVAVLAAGPPIGSGAEDEALPRPPAADPVPAVESSAEATTEPLAIAAPKPRVSAPAVSQEYGSRATRTPAVRRLKPRYVEELIECPRPHVDIR